MEAGDRKAFDTILGEMFAALDKPLGEVKTEAFWKGLQRLSILELARIRDEMLTELETSEPPKSFSVADVWTLKRKLKARAPVAINQHSQAGQYSDGALQAEITQLTANDKPDRAGEFSALVRQSVRNWEELRRKDPEKWRKNVQRACLDRILATQHPGSSMYEAALNEWQPSS